jgi:UDP-N-acetylglucosamine:LPS N-acetylglucosamine transferase
MLLPEAEVTGESLAHKITELLDDPQRLSDMSARASRLAPENAAERVAQAILKFCEQKS